MEVDGAVFIHRLDHLAERKKQSTLSQYILNPTLSQQDLYYALKVLVCFVSLRLILCGALRWRKWSRQTALLPKLFRGLIKPKRRLKFAENLWYFVWHLVAFTWGVYVLYSEALTPEAPGWSRYLFTDFDSKWYWFVTNAEVKQFGSEGWPLFPVQPAVTTFYLTQLGFWLSCFAFVWIETMRKDFKVLIVHHIAACTLISFSYICSYWRVGTVVLVVHDSADIFLYLAKTLHYTWMPDRIVDAVFVVFVAIFCISRLMIYPLLCVVPLLRIGKFTQWTNGLITSHWDVPAGIAMPAFLCLLQVLHIFWFGLIVKMIIRTLGGKKTTNEVGDVRSEDEDEDVEEEVARRKASPTAASVNTRARRASANNTAAVAVTHSATPHREEPRSRRTEGVQ